MLWSQSRVAGVLHFRTLLLSRRCGRFWGDRSSAAAARDDSLALAA